MKRLIALLSAVCLLAGCSAGSGTPATPAPAPAQTQPAQLDVYCDAPEQSALRTALDSYLSAMQLPVNYTQDAAGADLVLTSGLPEGESWLNLADQPLLAAAAQRAGLPAQGQTSVTSLPLGRSLYAYWANRDLLVALLGEQGLSDLQNASWGEWQNFVQSVTGWIAAPSAIPLTLNGNAYTLPAQAPEAAQALEGVFALSGADAACAWGGPVFTSAMLAAGGDYSAQTLTGPVGSVYSALTLELENAAGSQDRTQADAARALADGQALFCRISLADLAAVLGSDGVQGMTPIPFKCYFVQQDLTTQEYTLTGLMNYPTLACAGYLSIPDTADNVQGAESAILWMYGSGNGNTTLTSNLLLVTPWNTASDATDLGALQVQIVSTGILPEVALNTAQNRALGEAGRTLAGSGSYSYLTRDAFIQSVLAVLAG